MSSPHVVGPTSDFSSSCVTSVTYTDRLPEDRQICISDMNAILWLRAVLFMAEFSLLVVCFAFQHLWVTVCSQPCCGGSPAPIPASRPHRDFGPPFPAGGAESRPARDLGSAGHASFTFCLCLWGVGVTVLFAPPYVWGHLLYAAPAVVCTRQLFWLQIPFDLESDLLPLAVWASPIQGR